ncbi:hypothetical protein COV17_00995 [Candidatus Woesearchaeota archaeon CG10_big_fil_rev_8_21_14_0_10_36_11]|nr:MAG: hypothetical protein COV17_00995 [Candidatus Woesearchaeota archaeon CG10_big_fil_rev_8_21_14_0_10_36_11]
MNRYPIIVICIFIFVCATAYAQDDVTFTFISPDNQDFSGYFATIQLGDAVQKVVLHNSQHTLPLIDGPYTVDITLDSFDTPTPDYYGSKSIVVPSDVEVSFFMYPIGYLQGTVVDMEGNLVPSARIQFTCYSSITVEFPYTSDAAGFFSVPQIPIGRCTVVASSRNVAGREDIEIRRGEDTSVEIVLGQNIDTSFSTFKVLLWGFIVFAILIVFISSLLRRQTQKKKIVLHHERQLKERKQEESREKETVSKQIRVLLQTLSEKERVVVTFLLEHDNIRSQAQIRHATHIPRTSIARILQTLERKKIITIKKDGKMVSVKLTNLFLGSK